MQNRLLAGGIITWICAKLYYERSSQELRQESQKLRSHLQIILFGLNDAGVIDLTWDPQRDLPVAIRLRNSRLPGMVGNDPSDASQEPRASSETDAERPEGAESSPAIRDTQNGSEERRSWWRRMFGS